MGAVESLCFIVLPRDEAVAVHFHHQLHCPFRFLFRFNIDLITILKWET